MGKSEKLILTEHTLEIRHNACGHFLDVRGNVADFILSNELFPHWRIDPNIVNFRDSNSTSIKFGAFAGYKSAGYFVFNPETRNLFKDKATKYWKILNKNLFYTIPNILRFGCRTKAFLNSEKNSDEINNSLYNKFFSSEFQTMIGGEETDLHITIELKYKIFSIRIICGPIHKEEANRYFNFSSDHFSQTGIFIDIDIWKTSPILHTDVLSYFDDAMKITWEKIDNISKEIGF